MSDERVEAPDLGDGEDRPFAIPLLKATRPKTLVAAAVPVFLGFALAHAERGVFSGYLLAFTLASTLCLQIATNFFNDVIDHRKGADTNRRLGPERMAGSGALAPESLIIAAITVLMLAITMSLPLIFARGWPILAIGVPSLYLTYGYTGGPLPLAYRGLGEIFVLLFFGFVAVAGACFVACGEWLPQAFLLGLQAGAFATVLIAINNARDIEEDRAAGKRTLASRWGLRFARWEILFWSALPYLVGFLWLRPFDDAFAALLPLMGLPFSMIVVGLVWVNEPGAVYNKALGLAAFATLNFAILMGIALLVVP